MYKEQEYLNTRSLVKDQDAWFERYLMRNEMPPAYEVYERLHDIRYHMDKTFDRLRFMADERAIEEELQFGQKAMIGFERFKPVVSKEVHRVLTIIMKLLKERERDFVVQMGFNDFAFADRISFTMRHATSGYLLQSKEKSPFHAYDNSIPTRLFGMNEDEIRNIIL